MRAHTYTFYYFNLLSITFSQVIFKIKTYNVNPKKHGLNMLRSSFFSQWNGLVIKGHNDFGN